MLKNEQQKEKKHCNSKKNVKCQIYSPKYNIFNVFSYNLKFKYG